MAVVTLTLVDVCAGGGHATINANLNAVNKGDYQVSLSNILNGFPDEQIPVVIEGLLRLYKIGKTNQQVKDALTLGLIINV